MKESERAYSSYLAKRKQDGLHRSLQAIDRPNARQIIVNGKEYINFSSNDYLGLSHHPDIISAATDALQQDGASASASRLVTGNLAKFDGLERKVAAQKGKQAALILQSGYQTNLSVLEALFDKTILGADPLVYSDRLNHASMHMGCKAAGVRQLRYRHCDATHLSELLDKDRDKAHPKFILSESVFSMDGDIAPLEELRALADQYDALLIVDDAHGAGVHGSHGAGLGALADIVIGTFSKAYGVFGAYVATTSVIKDYLINRCGGLIYSTGLLPAAIGAIDAATTKVPQMDDERVHLLNLASKFRAMCQDMGFDTGTSTTHIVPVIIGEPEQAEKMSTHLKDHNFWATSIRPPSVPLGSARLRFAFSAAHSEEDVLRLLDALKISGPKT